MKHTTRVRSDFRRGSPIGADMQVLLPTSAQRRGNQAGSSISRSMIVKGELDMRDQPCPSNSTRVHKTARGCGHVFFVVRAWSVHPRSCNGSHTFRVAQRFNTLWLAP
ncbi:hypothetical protein B0H67DRAFT_251536 [Lasiosphaeris hirsuta]|uniref:Uncharacterized protein n=1 Tax=Lasiosphaeris hirsuta TaxID=260670 RepID=A0AA40AHB4_9PEZI|nr:hypothetical protein B0H67DRAFT_251536 [Lasiosphaeris hirsuta]